MNDNNICLMLTVRQHFINSLHSVNLGQGIWVAMEIASNLVCPFFWKEGSFISCSKEVLGLSDQQEECWNQFSQVWSPALPPQKCDLGQLVLTSLFVSFFLPFSSRLVKWSSGGGEETKKSATGCDQWIVNSTALLPSDQSTSLFFGFLISKQGWWQRLAYRDPPPGY